MLDALVGSSKRTSFCRQRIAFTYIYTSEICIFVTPAFKVIFQHGVVMEADLPKRVKKPTKSAWHSVR